MVVCASLWFWGILELGVQYSESVDGHVIIGD